MSEKYGILYGVGVGPGEPELMTLKAVKCIRQADVIFCPQQDSRAYHIAEQAVPEIREKKCLSYDFKMTRDPAELKRVHEGAYREIKKHLQEEKNVAFLTIGDPSVYSTFSYVAYKARADGFCVETVPGATAFLASASWLGISLCEGDEELHIGTGQSDIEKLLALPGTKIIMKCGRNLPKIKEILRAREKEQGIKVWAVSDCGMETEKIHTGADEIPEMYMTTIIVK